MDGGELRGIPAGLPVLDSGRHLSPQSGACVMELASLLAGEPWSDAPRCTHRLLAQIAQMVNDGCSPAGRGRLVRLAGELADARAASPYTAATLVLTCTELAGEVGSGSVRLCRDHRRASRRIAALDHTGGTGLRQRTISALYARGPARQAVIRATDAIAGTPGPEVHGRDDRLLALLTRCVSVCRGAPDANGRATRLQVARCPPAPPP